MFTVLLRAIILYFLVIFAIRLMGKRQLGELQPTELVITILISNIASLPIEDPSIPMVMGAIPILTLVGFELIISSISLKSRKFRKLISGKPVIVIRHGILDQNALRELRFSIDDLMESLRAQGVFDITDVNYAIVETTGSVSILQKEKSQPLTPDILQMNIDTKNPPILLISDGELLENSLNRYNIPLQWLKSILKKNNTTIEQVFLLTCDDKLNYFIVPKQENISTK